VVVESRRSARRSWLYRSGSPVGERVGQAVAIAIVNCIRGMELVVLKVLIIYRASFAQPQHRQYAQRARCGSLTAGMAVALLKRGREARNKRLQI